MLGTKPRRKYPDPEEVARWVNEEYYAEQRKFALEKKRRELMGEPEPEEKIEPKIEQNAAATEQAQFNPIQHCRQSYNALEWEPSALRLSGGIIKVHYHYHESMRRLLHKAGYSRHPSSSEVFSLICDYLDQGRGVPQLSAELAHVAKDILDSDPEFFCQAVELEEFHRSYILHVYENVTALHFDSSTGKYDRSPFAYSNVHSFNLGDLSFGAWNPYRLLYDRKLDTLIEYLVGRPFMSLPPVIQENGGLYIQQCGLCPLGRGWNNKYSISAYIETRASRGVRLK
jgi:hypothetical protein